MLVSSLVQRVAFWSLPLKLIISAVLGIIGSAGLLGWLSEYGTYYYAIHFGFRPPLEGIPYLKPAVGLGSFLLIITSAAIFFVVVVILRYFIVQIKLQFLFMDKLARYVGRDDIAAKFKVEGYNFLKEINKGPKFWVGLSLSSLLFILFLAVVYFDGGWDSFWSWLGYPLAVSVLCVGFSFAAVDYKSIWWCSAFATMVYFLFVVFLLFSPVKNADLFGVLGYGGGSVVTVRLSNGSGQVDAILSGNLMIRTNEAVILYIPEDESFVEIPKSQIKQISHGLGGLYKLPYHLPVVE